MPLHKVTPRPDLTPDSCPQVTILSKGHSGGHTAFTPTENMQWHNTKAQVGGKK